MKRREKLLAEVRQAYLEGMYGIKAWEERDLQMMKEFVSCTCGECWRRPYVIYEDASVTKVKFVIARGGEA